MVFTTEDRFSLNITDWLKIWQKKNMHEFPNKTWSASGLDKLIKKIDKTDRTNGSGKPKSLNQKIGHQTALT